MTTPAVQDPWRCPRCDAERAVEDDFCGRCGARRPTTPAAPGAGDGVARDPGSLPTTAADDRRDGFPVRRALILNGVLLAAVVLAVVLSSNGRPTGITFEPAAWRCDGSERAWLAAIPARAVEVRIEWRMGGPEGEIRAATTTARIELERYLGPDGTFRVTTTATDAKECVLAPGRYTVALRDAASNALVASGEVELAP